MNDVMMQKQLNQIEQELRLSGEYAMDRLIQLRAEIDMCKLEMEALRRFLKSAFPEFSEQYDVFLEKARLEFNPD